MSLLLLQTEGQPQPTHHVLPLCCRRPTDLCGAASDLWPSTRSSSQPRPRGQDGRVRVVEPVGRTHRAAVESLTEALEAVDPRRGFAGRKRRAERWVTPAGALITPHVRRSESWRGDSNPQPPVCVWPYCWLLLSARKSLVLSVFGASFSAIAYPHCWSLRREIGGQSGG